MKSRRLLFLSSLALVLGLVGLVSPASASGATRSSLLCGPMCYPWCPVYAQLESDCQTMGSGCHTSDNCGVGPCGADGSWIESDCFYS